MNQEAISVLLTSLGALPEAQKKERLAPISPELWRATLVLARQHGVAPLLHHHLKRMGVALPGDVADQLKQARWQNALWNLRLYRELGQLLRLLQVKDIPVMALKGVHLAEIVFKDIGSRLIGDIDLLVRREDLSRVEQELLAYGCKPREHNRIVAPDLQHFTYILPEIGLSVEIHWALVGSKYPLPIDIAGIWSRAKKANLANAAVWVMSPEDLVVYLCFHAVRHLHQISIRVLADLAVVLVCPGLPLNWDTISQRAHEWGIVRAVYAMLRLTHELLNVPVPQDWLESLPPGCFDEHRLAQVREEILRDRGGIRLLDFVPLARLGGRSGFLEKMKIARDRLLLPRETMARMYPAPANSWRIYLYYPVRVKDVLVRHGRRVWRLARGDRQARLMAKHANEVIALQEWLLSPS